MPLHNIKSLAREMGSQNLKGGTLQMMANGAGSMSVENSTRKNLSSPLTLTSLVDCFTILVVYMLVTTSVGSEEMPLSKNMTLPTAVSGAELKLGNILKIDGNKYYLNEQPVAIDSLTAELKKAFSSKDSVIIQADKKSDFASVNPAVLSALEAGFNQVKFAVLKEE